MGVNFTNRKLEEFNDFLYERRVAFVGLDKRCISIIDYFHRHNARISVFDKRTLDNLNVDIVEQIINYNINYSLGENCLKRLNRVDLIIKSSEYRPDEKEILEAENMGAIVVSTQDLLIELCPGKVIGIVGDYNVDIVYLLCTILKEAKYECFLDDNPNKSLLCRVNKMNSNSILIMPINEKELFSLKYIPDISIVDNIKTNVDESFMSYSEYIEAIRIYSNRQICKGRLVFNADTNFEDDYLLNNSNVTLYSVNKRLDNGIIFDNNTIKICYDGIRRHFMDDTYLKTMKVDDIANICATFACTLNLVGSDAQINFLNRAIGR
ncbi:MAG: hypothetical protein J6J36_05185 [Clostridia bacterium]|nr:hypothetical protein [Clostridia bacterium]